MCVLTSPRVLVNYASFEAFVYLMNASAPPSGRLGSASTFLAFTHDVCTSHMAGLETRHPSHNPNMLVMLSAALGPSVVFVHDRNIFFPPFDFMDEFAAVREICHFEQCARRTVTLAHLVRKTAALNYTSTDSCPAAWNGSEEVLRACVSCQYSTPG